MLKIKLDGCIVVSSDLSNKLRARGLLDSKGSASEDLYLYIQECLARDNSALVGTSVTQVISEQKEVTDSTPRKNTEEQQVHIEDNKSSTVRSIDRKALSSEISRLYGGM